MIDENVTFEKKSNIYQLRISLILWISWSLTFLKTCMYLYVFIFICIYTYICIFLNSIFKNFQRNEFLLRWCIENIYLVFQVNFYVFFSIFRYPTLQDWQHVRVLVIGSNLKKIYVMGNYKERSKFFVNKIWMKK